jgi:cephalosporin hydroxylase
MIDPKTTQPADPGVRLKQAIRSRWGEDRAITVHKSGAYFRVARVLRRLSEDVAVREARRAVRGVVRRRPSIEDALRFAYSFESGGFDTVIRPTQIPSEIESLLRYLEPRRSRTVLEIGTDRGGTLFLFATVAEDDALLVSVDLPLGPFGGGYAKRRGRLYRAFARRGQRIELLRQDSHAASTVEAVERILEGRHVDLLFIDGDHTYEGVAADFRLYSPFVCDGGSIVFHDIVPGAMEHVGGVPRFWQELKASEVVTEFVADWNQGGYGLGVLTRPHDSRPL